MVVKYINVAFRTDVFRGILMVGSIVAFKIVTFLCRSVVHRLGTRDDTGSRQDHRGPRDAGIDGTWSHDKFQKHDQLVSYPIHHQAILEQREERAMEGEVEKDENREHTDNAMDTM